MRILLVPVGMIRFLTRTYASKAECRCPERGQCLKRRLSLSSNDISIHIPKTGGSSFAKVLKEVYADKLWVNHDLQWKPKLPQGPHSR